MKKMGLVAAALMLSSLPVFAASLGYQQMTSLSTSVAVNLTLTNIPASAGSALIYAEGAGFRWRDDGSDPTSTVGMPIAAGQAFCYINDIRGLRVIGQTAGAIINVTYYQGGTCR